MGTWVLKICPVPTMESFGATLKPEMWGGIVALFMDEEVEAKRA